MTNIYLITAFIKDVCLIMLCVLVLGYITGRIDQQYTHTSNDVSAPLTGSQMDCDTDTECEEMEVYLNAHNLMRM